MHEPTQSFPPATGTFPPGDATVSKAETPADTPEATPVIDGYELLGEIGRGGMGIVYRAREIKFDRRVAVKVLHPRYPADSPTARRFLDE